MQTSAVRRIHCSRPPRSSSRLGGHLARFRGCGSQSGNQAGQYTLAWELTKLGYEVDRSDRTGEPFEVYAGLEALDSPGIRVAPAEIARLESALGRDPLERYRNTLGQQAGRLHRPGVERDVTVIDSASFVPPWQPEPLVNRIAVERELLDRDIETVQRQLWRAQEDALILEGRTGGRPTSALDDSILHDYVDQLTRVLDALIEDRARLDEGRQARPSAAQDGASLNAEGIAEVEAGRSPSNARRVARDGVSVDDPFDQVAESSQIEPGDVPMPDPFDAIEVIGEQRRQLYTTQMQPLADGLQRMPSSWVARRQEQLGPPEAHVDRQTARLTRLIESRVEVTEQELRQAQETGTTFDRRGLERKLADLREQVQQLREDGLHIDQKLNPDQLIRSAAYAKEHAIRQARETAQPPERTSQPSARDQNLRDNLERLTGGLPAPQTADLDQWESLARELEARDGRRDELPAPPLDSVIRRYRAGMPPRDEGEREAYREWRELDADDLESAIEERLLPDQEYERYEGPLDWNAWLAERNRHQELERFGIGRPELPAPFVAALGHERAERLSRMVEDARLEHAYSPRSHEELTAQAQQLEAAGETLNLELSGQVAELEQQASGERESLRDASRQEGDLWFAIEDSPEGPEREQLRNDREAELTRAQHHRDRLRTLSRELSALSEQDDHPDRWLDGDGRRFADALAATLQPEQERTLADTPPDQASELPDSHEQRDGTDGREPTDPHPARETPDAGRDLF